MNIENCLILDANAFCHRSYHGYDEKINLDGGDSRVLYGVLKTISSLERYFDNISYLFIVFDSDDGYLYRKSIFPSYKENRKEKEKDFIKQHDEAKKVLKNNFGIPTIVYPGYEADDAIASIARYFEKQNNKVTIISPDKDLFQMVNENIQILRPYKSKGEKGMEFISIKGVEKYFGVLPHEIPDYLALMGDAVDNIPGIAGIGAKKAISIIKNYISVEHLCAIKNDFPSTINKIINDEHLLFLPLYKQLTTVKDDLDNIHDYISNSLKYAENIQSSLAYKQSIFELRKFYNFSDEMIDIFIR